MNTYKTRIIEISALFKQYPEQYKIQAERIMKDMLAEITELQNVISKKKEA